MKDLLNLDIESLNNVGRRDISIVKKVCSGDIAVIGMNAKLPMANSIDEFWNNLKSEKDCIRNIPESRRQDTEYYLRYVNPYNDNLKFDKGAYLDDIDKFDYSFFNITPKEASLMDPNQRLFLQCAWGTIEDAGYGGKKIIGSRTGVYVGFCNDSEYNEYKKIIADVEPESLSISVPGNISSVIGSRISYLLDLKGPSMLINTACSSSLVAVHTACQAIRSGECDMAIAGSVQTYLIPIRKTKIGVEAFNFKTKAFDNNADGLGAGEGVVSLLLKPLSGAIRDRDNIYAVIKGSSVNQDGASLGLTAPNASAQEDVITRAWEDAEILPETISYIEAHGTGTQLGDTIEIDGIRRAFEKYTSNKQFCAVGSVKTNIGHLDSAAGIAGLLKAILAIKNKQLPSTLNFNEPNKKISFIDSPVYVNNSLSKWEVDSQVRRCGVSSFGLSGTNCHVVLEEYQSESKHTKDRLNLLVISAKSRESLNELINKYKEFAIGVDNLDLGNICYTANAGRGHYKYRLALILKDIVDFKEKIMSIQPMNLENQNLKEVYFGIVEKKEKNSFINIEPTNDRKDLEEICNMYINGEDINWDNFYKNQEFTKVRVPIYQFEKKRCWIDIPEKNVDKDISKATELYYTTSWEKEDLIKRENSNLETAILVLIDSENIKSKEMIKKLNDKGKKTIEIILDNKFAEVSENTYMIDGRLEQYDLVLNKIKDIKFNQILHMTSIENHHEIRRIEELEKTQQKGVYSLLRLTKALAKMEKKNEIDILLISQYVDEVTGNEKRINSENATLFGLGKNIGWELPNLKCRCIDIDESTSLGKVIDEIDAENPEYKVAYRDGFRYIESINHLNVDGIEEEKINIKENGVYVITGGLGRIGIEFSKYLARNNKVNLILLNRSMIPAKAEWKEVIKDSNNEKLVEKISEIINIESNGSNVECYNCDVTNPEQIEITLKNVREKYGKINGIIHSAAVGVGMNGMTIENEDETIFRMVSDPKIKGTWLLDNLTQEDNLDFFVMFSSVITLVGGTRGADYISSNSYLDSFSKYRSKKGRKTLTIDWPVWTDAELKEAMQHDTEKQLFKFILPDTALHAFQAVISKKINRVMIGEFNYNSKIFELGKYLPFKLSNQMKKYIESAKNISKNELYYNQHEIKNLKLVGKEEANYTDTEKVIADCWREVLGFDELNVNDNFFEIGGDSISVTKLYSMIEERYPGEVVLSDFFAYPTISKLAQYLNLLGNKHDNLEGNKDDKQEIMSLFDAVEKGKLSIDKAIKNYSLMEE